ncbi:DUF4976 domain-containing protein [Occultella glacieicola]|uniref:DUF4976 domain-containing protein n=1 Tax=Occultella glacieicola TaxID=2518684 RepID=A0ABY2DYB6_9MICO|nr:sulfatase [Occultella glacieicola]TDE89476.1 DUF4976 domain-containing protein [Occultella glacieicola]
MAPATGQPNLLVIMSDDHAAHAISAYGSRVNTTPNIDRIATAGVRFDNCFCTNSICTPSRAAILTGEYNHVNGVRTLFDDLDNTRPQVQAELREVGYQTAIVGKWHLGEGPAHDPAGFDHWRVLRDQGEYHDPVLVGPDGPQQHTGYVTDIITDLSLEWLEQRERDRPFLLMLNHKAPHRSWEPDAKHRHLYPEGTIPEPPTFDDDLAGRSRALDALRMSMADLDERDLKLPVPEGLTAQQERSWRYQRYLADYLRCVASVDDNVGRVLDWLEEHGLTANTLVVYTSDQGFFLGDHGWYDKRLMYEESLRMPFLASYPPLTSPGTHCPDIVTNVDLAPTLLELAGAPLPGRLQGHSMVDSLAGREPAHRQTDVYYRYWEHLSDPHRVPAHLGVRTEKYKLICYLDGAAAETSSEIELYDLSDPSEVHNVYADPAYAEVAADLIGLLRRRQLELGDTDLVTVAR